MAGFREDSRFLIYYTSIFGLYMKSIESVTDSKWIIGFLTVWTKIPTILLPLYILWDIRSLVFDQMTVLSTLAMVRKVFIYTGFFLKNILFYYQRDDIEKLIDLWDDSFKENFYPDVNLLYRKKNIKETKSMVRGGLTLVTTAALSYTIPSFFSKKKIITHPSGLIYPHRSPEFELAVVFDVCASLSCASGAVYDYILVVFLMKIRSKLEFLTVTLTDIVNEIVVNDEGKLLGRQIKNRLSSEMKYHYEETEKMSVKYERNITIVENKLKIWILHHQQTIFFFEQLSKVYSNVATFQLGSIVIYTGLTALNIVQVKLSLGTIGVILAASSNLTSLFLWCKLSGELMDIDPFTDAFSRSWYLYPKKVVTAFSFIIMRSNKRLSLNGFSIFSMSLMTFFEILKLTYQFSAFMVQMTGKEG